MSFGTDFLARLPARFCISKPKHHMKPRRERSDDVGPGRLGGIPSFIYAEKEGLLVSYECWSVDQDCHVHVQNALSWMFPDIPN